MQSKEGMSTRAQEREKAQGKGECHGQGRSGVEKQLSSEKIRGRPSQGMLHDVVQDGAVRTCQ